MQVDLTKQEIDLLQEALDNFESACDDEQLEAIDRIGQKLIDVRNAHA
jgi:hypothetical protein